MSKTEGGRQIPIEKQSNTNSITVIRITCFNLLRIYYIHYILYFFITSLRDHLLSKIYDIYD